MAFSKINVELENLTPELAKHFASLPHVPGERDLKVSHLKFLKRLIKNRSFVGPNWAVAICRGTKQKFRLDGQHSSAVLADTIPEDFPRGPHGETLLATVTTYEFDSMSEDGFAMFDMFDNPRSARANKDVMGYHRAAYMELHSIDNGFLQSVTNGIAFHEKNIKDGRVLAERERGQYLRTPEYREFIIWLQQFRNTRNAWVFGKAGVVAEILSDWKHSMPIAEEFWTLVFTESHGEPEHETRELAETLKSWRTKEQRTQDQFRRRAQRVWNRYRRERELESRAARVKAHQPSYQQEATL